MALSSLAFAWLQRGYMCVLCVGNSFANFMRNKQQKQQQQQHAHQRCNEIFLLFLKLSSRK